VPYLSASVVVIHYEEALYQVYAPLPLPLRGGLRTSNLVNGWSTNARNDKRDDLKLKALRDCSSHHCMQGAGHIVAATRARRTAYYYWTHFRTLLRFAWIWGQISNAHISGTPRDRPTESPPVLHGQRQLLTMWQWFGACKRPYGLRFMRRNPSPYGMMKVNN